MNKNCQIIFLIARIRLNLPYLPALLCYCKLLNKLIYKKTYIYRNINPFLLPAETEAKSTLNINTAD